MTHRKHAAQKVLREWRNNGEMPYKSVQDGRIMGGGQAPPKATWSVLYGTRIIIGRIDRRAAQLVEGALNREMARWTEEGKP